MVANKSSSTLGWLDVRSYVLRNLTARLYWRRMKSTTAGSERHNTPRRSKQARSCEWRLCVTARCSLFGRCGDLRRHQKPPFPARKPCRTRFGDYIYHLGNIGERRTPSVPLQSVAVIVLVGTGSPIHGCCAVCVAVPDQCCVFHAARPGSVWDACMDG